MIALRTHGGHAAAARGGGGRHLPPRAAASGRAFAAGTASPPAGRGSCRRRLALRATASGCILAAGAAPQPAAAAPLHGAGWRVLPDGNTDQLPLVRGRPLPADASPLGEFGEFEARGAAAFLLDRFRQFGPLFTWQLGDTQLVTLLDYPCIKSLLTAADGKAITGWNPEGFYAILGDAAREGLEQPAVRVRNRAMMQPGFTREALIHGYFDRLVTIVKRQLDAWADAPVDLVAEGKTLSFEFSTQIVVNFDVPPERKRELRAKFDALFQAMFAPPDPTPGSRFSRGLEAREALLDDIAALVAQREARSKGSASSSAASSSAASSSAASSSAASGRSVFDFVVDDRRAADGSIDLRQAAQSGIGLIIAANDTSGLGMSALVAILALMPDVMRQLREEQQQVVAAHGTRLTPAVLDAMPLADAVVREVLRVAPPSASIGRQTLADMEILGHFVPAGSRLLLSTYLAQVLTDPRLHHEALRLPHAALADAALGPSLGTIDAASLARDFKPERWLQGGRGAGRGAHKPSGLLTFSAGPHVCLGMSLFFTEAKVLIALLARGYTLELQDPEQLAFGVSFVTQLRQGGSVRFTRLPQPVPPAVS